MYVSALCSVLYMFIVSLFILRDLYSISTYQDVVDFLYRLSCNLSYNESI